MKKTLILFSLLIVSVLIGCSKDDNDTNKECNLLCNLHESFTAGEKGDLIITGADGATHVALFNDEGKDIDFEKSSVSDKFELCYTDGSSTKTPISMKSGSVNIFENLKPGKYVLFAYYRPWELLYHYSIKQIEIQNEIEFSDMTFIVGGNFGFQKWNNIK